MSDYDPNAPCAACGHALCQHDKLGAGCQTVLGYDAQNNPTGSCDCKLTLAQAITEYNATPQA